MCEYCELITMETSHGTEYSKGPTFKADSMNVANIERISGKLCDMFLLSAGRLLRNSDMWMQTETPIAFCPWCGRRLGGDALRVTDARS